MPCNNVVQKIQTVAGQIIYILDNINYPHNASVIFDIDNTLIDTKGVPINPIIHTYNHAKNKGLNIFIITARPGTTENINATTQQLSYFGISGYKRLYFLSEQSKDQATFKYHARQNVHEQGDNVVMSVGDMPWDIGDYGGIGVIVPSCLCCKN